MQTRTEEECGADGQDMKGIEKGRGQQVVRNKGTLDLTLRYKPLSSPSEDVALTTLNLDAPLLGKRGPIMHLVTR